MNPQNLSYGIVLFETTHDAILGEKKIRTQLPVALMPIPRQYSSGCGIVLRFEAGDKTRMEALLSEYQIKGRIEFIEGDNPNE